MEIKIECPCETRFAFDVEPMNGRMPVRVNCPACGADRTDLANEVIHQNLTAAPGPAAAAVAAPPARPAPARPPVRVAVPSSEAEAAPIAATSVTFCFRHLKNPAVETCHVCGKPICNECMEQYGYACSIFCRKRAEETGVELPVYARHRAVVEARITRIAAWIWRVAVLVAAVCVGVWGWYTFFASHPRVVYSEQLLHGDRARFYQLLAPHQVLLIKADRMSLLDVEQQRSLWSVPLNVGFYRPPPRDKSVPDLDEQVRLYPEPHVIATTNDLWILFPGRLVQYDRHSGNAKQQIPLNPPFFGLAQNDGALSMISSDESGQQIMTRVALADGTVKTDPIKFTKATVPPSNSVARPLPAAAPALSDTKLGRVFAAAKSVLPANNKPEEWESPGDQFVADGANVVQVKMDLLEHKTILRQAMRNQKKKAQVDGNLTAGQSLEAAEEMLNEARRAQTGGEEEEDVSRYQVTLRRWPAGAAPDWIGEVVGPPSFFALKTLNVLVARNIIRVFDKNNQPLWTANLTYSIAPHYSEDFATEADPPCVESGNTLFVFDQGMLTSFDASTGAVHWRLTSVGISQVQLDGQKHLYVTSTTASPDTIQFSQQVDIASKAGPVILKVDAATGKVLWRTESIGTQCFVSGKYVYIAKAATSPLITPGEDPVYYFDLYRLSPADGHPMWDYSQSRQPVQIGVQGNEILIHFKGELQVLKFLSL